MKKIIICLSIICLFLLSGIASSSTLTIANDGDDELDQYNELSTFQAVQADSGEYSFAQSFTPTYNILTRVELQRVAFNMGLKDVKLTIRSDINGNNIVMPIYVKPDDCWHEWLEFDIPDLQVFPGETYYLVWKTMGGGTNGNHGSDENPYPNGNAYGFGFWAPLGEWVSKNNWDFCFKTYGRNGNDGNNPPDVPILVSQLDIGHIGVEQTFKFKVSDPDSDKVKIIVNWDDGTTPTETSFLDSNEELTISHIWDETGVYWMNVKAMDEHGSESFSDLICDPFYISSNQNTAPMKPELSGDSGGEFGSNLEFSVTTYDCDKDEIYYMFDWGDDTVSDWLGPYKSGMICTVTNSWNGFLFTDYYDVSVVAKDSGDLRSKWSEPMEVKIYQGRAKNLQNSFFHNLFEKIPLFEKIFDILKN